MAGAGLFTTIGRNSELLTGSPLGPPEVVWNLSLQAGSEGPALISRVVAHPTACSAVVVLVAHVSPLTGKVSSSTYLHNNAGSLDPSKL
jgi:hypothetical protein